MKVSIALITITLCAVMSSKSSAHHSSASTFTTDRTSTIEGVVSDFRFRNPHVLIHLDVSNADGSIKKWVAEAGAATGFRRNGWQASTLKEGDLLRISGDATIDGSPMVWVDKIEFLDKTTRQVLATLDDETNPADAFSSQSSQQTTNQSTVESKPYFMPLKLPTGEPNFSGITARSDDPQYEGPPDGNDPALPYNETGKTALDAWALINDPQVFCDQPGLVRQGGYTPYGQNIKQYPDHITIEYEEYGSKRAIFFNDKLPKSGVRSHLGDSVARYEGDTLVIETINLLANASGHRGRPLSNQAMVTEVFKRVEDPQYGSHLEITMTVHDPKFLTEPWTISRTKAYRPDYTFIENECVPPMRERPANVWQEPA